MIKKLLFLLYAMLPFYASGTTIGSDTAVSRFNSVVSLTNGTRIAGFAALWGGFSFANAATTAEFDSFFPVSGSIAINGGTLSLNRDLVLNDVLSVGQLGNIYGNGFRIAMPAIDAVPSISVTAACYTWSNLTIQEINNTVYSNLCITFTGNNTWTGNGAVVTFQSNCTFYIAKNSGLMFRDMTLVGLGQAKLIPLDTTSTVSFNNMNIVLDGNYTFSWGNLEIIGDVAITGEGTSFIFSSTGGGVINSSSRFIFDVDTTFMYAPINSSRTNLAFTDNTSQLVFNSATFSTSSVGMQLLQGMISFDGLCTIINQGNSLSTSLQIGDGINTANDVFVRWLPACNVELAQGMLRDSNV